MESPKQCFLIEDDADDREFFCMALERTHPEIQCLFAKDGIHAIEQLIQDTDFIPDFIFIDMMMPRMNGKECLGEIRKMQRLNETPVYIFTTAVYPNLSDELFALGANGILVKPTTVAELSDMLRKIF